MKLHLDLNDKHLENVFFFVDCQLFFDAAAHDVVEIRRRPAPVIESARQRRRHGQPALTISHPRTGTPARPPTHAAAATPTRRDPHRGHFHAPATIPLDEMACVALVLPAAARPAVAPAPRTRRCHIGTRACPRPEDRLPPAPAGLPATPFTPAAQPAIPFTPAARPGMTHRDEQNMRRRTKSTHIAEYLR